MNSQTIRGFWLIFVGRIEERWGRVLGDEVKIAAGKNCQLAGRIALRFAHSASPQDHHAEPVSHFHGG